MKSKDWLEFRDTGLFTMMNIFLQMFNWTIVVETDKKGKVISVYPARSMNKTYPDSVLCIALDKVQKFIGFREEEETTEEDEILTEEEKLETFEINNSEGKLNDILNKIKKLKDTKEYKDKFGEISDDGRM